jgi:hypothetical protein
MHGSSDSNVWIVGSASGWGDGVALGVPMALRWNGSELVEESAVAPGNRQNHFYGVTVVAHDDAWAVGSFNSALPHDPTFHAMIQHWDGSSWTMVAQPAQALEQTFLFDIVAIAPDDIWAVGEQPGGALFMHFDGSSWTIAPSPTTVTTRVATIAAIAPDDIWAASHFEPGYFHYDGFAWTTMGAPVVPDVDFVNRGGDLAAAGACDVWTVGSVSAGGWNFTFAEHLDADTGVAGDVTGDGFVDLADLLALLAAWGACDGTCPADLDGDGIVGTTDLLTVLANWT